MLETIKALADPCRLRLLAILDSGEFTVQELTSILGMGQSRISRHLKILTEAGVLAVKRQGTWSYYRMGDGNAFFAAISPAMKREFEALQNRAQDVAAVAKVLEDRRRRSREFFDRHARQWDALARTLLPVPEYVPQLVKMVPLKSEVLEVGVGTGILLPELAAVASKTIGVDHSPAMLEEAGRRVAEAGLAGVELRLGEMTHLPMADGKVGCVVANMVLHHAADPLAVLHEIHRVLAAGGMLLIADLARHERELAREQLADQWLGFEEQELANWLATAGFDHIACQRLEGGAGQVSVLLVNATKLTVSLPKRGRAGEGESIQEKRLFIPQPVPTPLLEAARRLRVNMTDAERILWRSLRNKLLGGYRFRRQHPLGSYVLDFFCQEAKLAVELDGGQHADAKARRYDAERSSFLERHGIQVIRFWNSEVFANLEGVLEKIYRAAQRVCPHPSPPPPGEGA